MNSFLTRNRRPFACLVLAAATATGVWTYRAVADDAAAPPAAQTHDHRAMIKEHMAKMKEMLSDPQKMEQMKTEMIKKMVMEKMAIGISHDSEFQKMHQEMMSDPAVTQMLTDLKATLSDPGKLDSIKKEIMDDPKEMSMVLHKAMMMDAIHHDPELRKALMGDHEPHEHEHEAPAK